MKIDIDNYIKTNTDPNILFSNFLMNKYSKNTYVNILTSVIQILENNENFTKIDFFSYYLYKYVSNEKKAYDENFYHNLIGKTNTENYTNKFITLSIKTQKQIL